jgi:hypothetical protein
VSKSGVQNKKRIVVRNPMIPVAKALVKIPDRQQRYGSMSTRGTEGTERTRRA